MPRLRKKELLFVVSALALSLWIMMLSLTLSNHENTDQSVKYFSAGALE